MACPALQDESTGSSGVQGKAYQSGQVHIIKRLQSTDRLSTADVFSCVNRRRLVLRRQAHCISSPGKSVLTIVSSKFVRAVLAS